MYFILDNYDSFVYNIYAYFQEIGVDVEIERIDKISLEEIIAKDPKAIILSPGPGHPKDAELSLKLIEYYKGKKPILGICLGHQAIGYFFGGQIKKGNRPIHGKVCPIVHSGKNLFKDIPDDINVTRYHSLIVDEKNIDDEFYFDAKTNDGVLMAMTHKKYPIYSLQFHPEAVLTEYGHEMIRNFIKISEDWSVKNA